MPNILIIDDNRNYQMGLAENLRREGFDVTIASDGVEGIKLANDILPELILCDVKMPAPDGMAVKRILDSDQATADIPFVFLSALSNTNIKNNGLQLGAEDYITKSTDLSELVVRIQAILRRKERSSIKAKQEVSMLLENLKTTLPIHTSHLYRTYLGIMLLSLETIRRQMPDSEQYLKMVYQTTNRLKMLVNDLIWVNEIDLGRAPTYNEQVDLDIAFMIPIHDVMKMWERKNLVFEVEVDPATVIVAPPRSFTQSICHLVDNACKFSPEGGLVKIIMQSNGPDGCILTVEDQGPGIPEKLHELVFKRFYQVPDENNLPQNQGLGLGLYLARKFARARGGDVTILETQTGFKIQMKLGYDVEPNSIIEQNASIEPKL